jgi:pimeloyl-ACP methyl ester carboxylesterase
MAWFWHRVAPRLQQAGREALAVDLPGDNESAGLEEYTEIVIEAIGMRTDVTLVAQSLAGFVAPLVCSRATGIRRLVFVNAMIPVPGETAGAWWDNTGAVQARLAAAKREGYSTEFDPQTYFLHDIPGEVLREAPAPREEADIVFKQPCEFDSWPQIPIHVIASTDDRLFPVDFQRRIARARLNADVDTIPGGHLAALSNPDRLVERLVSYLG